MQDTLTLHERIEQARYEAEEADTTLAMDLLPGVLVTDDKHRTLRVTGVAICLTDDNDPGSIAVTVTFGTTVTREFVAVEVYGWDERFQALSA